MARKLKSDRVLFLTTILLVGLSIVMVYSASAIQAEQRYDEPYFFVTRQAMWAAMGIAIMWVAMRIDYHVYREPVFIWTCLGAVLLALVAVLFRPETNNARRWLAIGGLGIQPSELAKLASIFFIAALLERRMQRINDIKYSLGPIVMLLGVLCGLIIWQPDFGTAMSLGAIAAAMVFTAGLSYSYIVGSALVSLPLLAVLVLGSPYRRRRIEAFLDPWADPLNSGFQIIQSLLAVGTGGLSGRGLMNGVQKLFYLPEAHNDFIYAVIGEELGLLGTTVVLGCFCVIAWRGIRIALRAPDQFGALLAIGLTAMVTLQAFFNISVVLGLVPPKGIPLPFVSAGGSSLLINLVGMGVLLNVSQHGISSARAAAAEP
jgi:cell division protein FtsW